MSLLKRLLEIANKNKAEEILICEEDVPVLIVGDEQIEIDFDVLSAEEIIEMFESVLPEDVFDEFLDGETDLVEYRGPELDGYGLEMENMDGVLQVRLH
jgi:hypothetical protein